jgi:hypothetical protein
LFLIICEIIISSENGVYITSICWVVHVCPWVVGIRGMIDILHVESLLKFLDIQRKHWRVAVEWIALASVRAFHRVRFGGPPEPVKPDLDPDNRRCTSDEEVSVAATKQKYRRQNASPALDDSDSDSQV